MAAPFSLLKDRLQDPKVRFRLIAIIFELGIVLGLPNPLDYMATHNKVLMFFLWFSLLGLALLIWTESYYVKIMWFLCLIASLLAWWKLHLFLPTVMIVLWAFWYSIRYARLQSLAR